MNLTAALRKSLSTSPIVAAVAYAGLVFVLVVLIVISIVDILGQRAAVASSAAMLEQLEGRRAAASGRRPADVLMPSGSAFLEGATVTIAGAALLQRVAARIVKASLGEVAKTEQRSRGVAGADQHAIAGERGDRRIDAFDQALQALDQRHRAAHRLGGRQQNAMAAIGKIKPRAAAGNEPAKRRAKPAQPLQPDRAGRRQPAREFRDLAPVLIRRTENFFGQRSRIGCAE